MQGSRKPANTRLWLKMTVHMIVGGGGGGVGGKPHTSSFFSLNSAVLDIDNLLERHQSAQSNDNKLLGCKNSLAGNKAPSGNV